MRISAKIGISFLLAGLIVAVAFAGDTAKEGPARAGPGEHHAKMRERFLKRLAEMDTNGDKQVSREEFNTATLKRFETRDSNHDGFLTREEVQSAFKDLAHKGFARLDRNGDGKISKDEFPGKPERFTALDTNADGFITKEELQARGQQLRDRWADKKPGEQIWKKWDANNDGKVARDEYIAAMKQLFDHLDRNGDGVLSKADLGGPRPLSQSRSPQTPRPEKAGSASGAVLP
ncbi:MAG: EF-hand domain-containing protein [bacterium JZ-2024 1]